MKASCTAWSAIALGDAFDGDDLGGVSLHERNEAAVHKVSVEQDRTRATLAFAASFLRARQVQGSAERVEQSRHRMSGHGDVGAVDAAVNRDGGIAHARASMRSNTRSGVIGMRVMLTPSAQTAFAIAGAAPSMGSSPIPFAPPGPCA